MADEILNRLSDKRSYFAGFGAIGGLLSGIIFALTAPHSPLMSWLIGIGGNGLFMAALLGFGQGRYAGKQFDFRSTLKAALVGGIGGLGGGIIGFFIAFPIARLLGGGEDEGRFLGWTLGGLAVGYAVSRVVPNLTPVRACLAGGIGGILGCALMYVIGSLTLGLVVTGAVIGLAIAFVESAFRSVWLDIVLKPRRGEASENQRTLSVTLGDDPVLFGCGSEADIKLEEVIGAGANFARVSLEEGRVIMKDLITERSSVLNIGETFYISNANVTLRSKSS